MKYVPLQIACNCSFTSLEMVALIIGPSFIYDLHVHPEYALEMRHMLKTYGATTKDHPLAPYINLISDDSLRREEWYLLAGVKACGSEGI